MKGFFYTKNDLIKNNLKKLDELRSIIALKSINPSKKYFYQWETLNKRIDSIINLYQIKLNLKNKIKYLFNDIYFNFYGKNYSLTNEEIVNFYIKHFNIKVIIDIKEIDEALKYIQISKEHPIIQGVLSKIIFYDLAPFSKFNEIFSDTILTIFLYQYGYDFERIIPIESIYQDKEFQRVFKDSLKSENLTSWIEFYTNQLINLIENSLKEIDNKKTENYSFLNDRQKEILYLFNEPNIKITNKIIMKKFKIAPVTAARDLAKLVKYNLIMMLGKGRSTYYIKI